MAALCEDTAIDTAVERGLAAPTTLFINIEPEALTASRLDAIVARVGRAGAELEVVLELTERALAAHPSELLAAADRIRSAGWRLALDDVGANDLSLTLMSLLRPEVIKLDVRMVQS